MIKAIVCIGANGVMGKDGAMPWGDMPLDGNHFRSLTEGHIVVMGRKTLESMDYKPLPNRMNIVLSRRINVGQRPLDMKNPLYSAFSVDEVLDVYDRTKPGVDLWVIGGSEVYKAFLPYIEEFYVTTVGEHFEGDTFFPDIHKEYDWESELIGSDEITIAIKQELPKLVFAKPVEMEQLIRVEMPTKRYMLLYRKFTKKGVTGVTKRMYSDECTKGKER